MKGFVLFAVAALGILLAPHSAFAIAVPDLSLTQAKVSANTVAPGAEFYIDVQVTNIGDGNASSYYTNIYLSKDRILDKEGLVHDTLLTSSSFPILAAGATYPPDPANLRRMTMTVPATSDNGYYYLIVIVDATEQISENSERNNLAIIPFTIAPYLCYGLVPGDSSVCTGHGICKGADFCSCTTGWAGDVCASPVCVTTCGSNSSCTAPDTCTCDSGYVETDHGCKDERCANEADWTNCVTGDLPSACFAERCEVLALNDTCTTATALPLDTDVSGSLWGAHPYQIVKDPLTNTIYEGRDVFHSFAADKDTCYKIILEMGSDLTGMGAIWKDCSTLEFFSPVLDPQQSAAMDLCVTTANTYIIQVMQQPTVVRKRPNWNYHLRATSIGCRIGALRCVGDDAEICDEGNAWIKKETCAAGACLEGVCGCENDTKQCDPTDVGKTCTGSADCDSGVCLEGKCVSMLPMTCVAHAWQSGVSCNLDREFCEDGACKARPLADGDLDGENDAEDGDSEATEADGDAVADGDTGEEPADGDVIAESDNDTTATDGDTTESDTLDSDSVSPPSGSKKGGGCQAGATQLNSLLVALFGILLVWRRRSRA